MTYIVLNVKRLDRFLFLWEFDGNSLYLVCITLPLFGITFHKKNGDNFFFFFCKICFQGFPILRWQVYKFLGILMSAICQDLPIKLAEKKLLGLQVKLAKKEKSGNLYVCHFSRLAN